MTAVTTVTVRQLFDDDSTDDDHAVTDNGLTQPRYRRPSAPLEAQRYAVGTALGSGGMGDVIAAFDLQIGREVAIKRLRAPLRSATALARFLREARIQGRLDHPAIAPVYELGFDDDGQPFFAMKRVTGTTLAEILRDPPLRATYSRARLLRAFADVCLAIEYAHARGIIHRDLKPSNILLGQYGEVYVIDWGVARMLDDSRGEPVADTPADAEVLTEHGAAIGTPGYMAPEQVRGEPDCDARADVYALGCILYEILAGQPLHPRGRAGMESAVAGVVARPSTHSEDIPPELDALCEQATATDRRARIASARAVGEAVQRYLDGDRDAELRRRHAAAHLAAAHEAYRYDDEAHRRIAIREAGRALALDPTSRDAADLVGRLVVAPPAATPSAVAEELASLDRAAALRMSFIGVMVHIGMFALAAFLFSLGLRGPSLIGFALLSGTRVATGLYEMKRERPQGLPINFALNAAVIAMLARMFTPFLVAPGLAAVTLMAFAFHPAAASTRVLVQAWVLSIAAVAGTWLLEKVGVFASTMSTSSGHLLLISPLRHIEKLPAGSALCIQAIVLLVIAALLAGSAARAQRAARHHLLVQTWQLSQLVAPAKPR